MNFLSEDVPDPTDFPPQAIAPGLRTLDGSFRCDICGELYDGPVTIACGHCFCSACIRNCLLNKQECPTCRKSANEVHIRPNPVLEDVISAWKEARPFVLGLTKRETERVGEKEASRKRKRSSENPSSSSSIPGNTPGPSNRDISSPTRTLKAKSPSKVVKKPRTKREGNAEVNVISSSESEEDSKPQALKFAPRAEDLVECPLCTKKIVYRELNGHMDNKCKNDSAAKSWSLLLGGSKNGQQKGKHKKKESNSDDEYPLPLTTYNTLKDRQLKDMLVEQELPITGNRSNWEQRHRQWIVLYNSNLDKSKPNRKTKADLRKDLKRWETENAKKKKTVIADVKAYQKEQKMEFAKLVEAARPKKAGEDASVTIDTSSPLPLPTSSSTAPGDATEITSEDE
ncbi:Postreplication repair E3 ubiquitin-protein ligase rad18 [Psilocybe cubensis]|uniref:Postreplication repair E3 ubiquitin-protein ligase RAD18 n=2 Tax=Psilocybe cubensis TaxID=181762 RepID=A0A8H8CN31_PSICU|nr:Postreplication repair E3 ubiquitin-protein ligase rad18 [Psilocybe cubensis]KAH9484088.1 Postreplication repair E3 ubiquitin-protein ligase rad18 [Psilocybe cubensis]